MRRCDVVASVGDLEAPPDQEGRRTMEACLICDHAKTQAITAALTGGCLLAVVATQYRVKKIDLLKHLQHAPIQALPPRASVVSDPADEGSTEADTPMSVLKRGLPYIQQAVRLAGDDRLAQERLVAVLNESLQGEHMGL